MRCNRCGNATEPMAEYNEEIFCSECLKPEVKSWLEVNREAIDARVIEILTEQMLPPEVQSLLEANREAIEAEVMKKLLQ